MLASLLIVFREVFEAGLILGIVLAATRGVTGRGRWIALGVGGGVAGACALALFADTLSAQFSGNGQELFNAGILLIAICMLAWHNIWMASHGRALAGEMNAVGRAVGEGERPPYALAVVVGAAVLREGSEVVLFLAGIAASDDGGAGGMIVGAAGGIALGALTSLLIYRGLLAVPTHRLFAVTGWLITLLAAGMASQAVAFLRQADLVTLGSGVLWDSSALLRDDSLTGRALHVLIGYCDRPTTAQILAYALVLTTITLLMRANRARPESEAR